MFSAQSRFKEAKDLYHADLVVILRFRVGGGMGDYLRLSDSFLTAPFLPSTSLSQSETLSKQTPTRVARVDYLHYSQSVDGSRGACHITVFQNILARQADYGFPCPARNTERGPLVPGLGQDLLALSPTSSPRHYSQPPLCKWVSVRCPYVGWAMRTTSRGITRLQVSPFSLLC